VTTAKERKEYRAKLEKALFAALIEASTVPGGNGEKPALRIYGPQAREAATIMLATLLMTQDIKPEDRDAAVAEWCGKLRDAVARLNQARPKRPFLKVVN
jgi:hypothetical protein